MSRLVLPLLLACRRDGVGGPLSEGPAAAENDAAENWCVATGVAGTGTDRGSLSSGC